MSLLDDVCVQVWRGRGGSSWGFAFGVFKRFWNEVLSQDARFVGLSVNDVVEWQRNSVGHDQYYILGLAQKWISQQNLRHSSMRSYLSYVCGVFNHNQASLPIDKGFRFKSSVPAVEGDLSPEKFRAILNNCNKLYRAVFLMMAQSLMGCNELLYVNKNLWHGFSYMQQFNGYLKFYGC